MKIGFWSEHLCERGTTTALYDYAFYNEKILMNESIIFYKKNHPINFQEYIFKFHNSFKCYPVNEFNEVDEIIKTDKIDALYLIKYGLNDGILAKNCPNLVHSVFVKDPHGEKYAFVSEFLSIKNGSDIPYIPHMIDLPEIRDNLRFELNIKEEDLVFGGFGGKDSFNISFVHSAIDQIVNEIPNIYFLFMNFDKNTKEHPRIIYLKSSIDKEYKVKFINTCDAMIHARNNGETFGLAVGEFSTLNKPIITYSEDSLKYDKEHIRILGDKGIYYKNKEELLHIFRNFIPDPLKDWNAYKKYNPKNVMEIFEKVFLNKITCLYDNKKWTLFQNDGISKHIINSEGWEPHLTNLFKELINEGDTVCDIGANFGYHTLTMSDCVGVSGKVFAFEPQRIIYNLLLRNLENNNIKNVIPMEIALSNINENSKINGINWISNNQNMGDNYIKNGDENITCKKLDDIIFEKISLLKIDVQGVEILVLEGMRNIIELYSPFIIIEVEEYTLKRYGKSSNDLFNYIRSLNYTIFYIEYVYPSDHLCVHNTKLDFFLQKYNKYIIKNTVSNHINNNLENGVVYKIKI